MARLRSRLLMLVLLVASFATSKLCTAAPVVLTQLDEFAKHSAMSAVSPRAAKPEVVKPPADPQRLPLRQLAGLIGPCGQSTFGSPFSTTQVNGTCSVHMTASPPTMTMAQPLFRRTPPGEEWLFIPPRFLDGVFRPPEARVSL